MTFTVQGGPTDGGRKRPLKPRSTDWTCPNCDDRNAYYCSNCPNCYERRPKKR